MIIPINEFEQIIDETILKRGFDYFNKGYVGELEEISNGEYETIVSGSDDYIVKLEISNQNIINYSCSCPYDHGPVCKHISASIFQLLKEELGLETKKKKKGQKGTTSKPSKKKTLSEQVDFVLDKINHAVLKEYITEKCNSDSIFRQLFLADFAHLIFPESKELYAKQVKALIKSSIGNSRYIDYYASQKVGKAVNEMVKKADHQLKSGHHKTAILIAMAVLEEMHLIIQNSEENNGYIEGCIDSSIDIFHKISEVENIEKCRIELYNYCLEAYKQKKFLGWDWHNSILSVLIELTKYDKERNEINLMIDQLIKETNDKWEIRKLQNIKLNLITKFQSELDVLNYLEENIDNFDFRKTLINKFIKEKNYDKAISFAKDGIIKDQNEAYGYVIEWQKYLLEIYQLTKNKDGIIQYAQALFSNHRGDEKIYFDILKLNLTAEKWAIFLNKTIKELSKGNHWYFNTRLANVYIWEQQFDLLFELLKSKTSLDNLQTYDKYLLLDYQAEIFDMYQKELLKYLERNTGRTFYIEACNVLKRLKKMGADKHVNFLINHFKTQYAKRPALLEELKKV
jgi:hypothetical protein